MELYRIEFASGAIVWMSFPSINAASEWAKNDWRNAFGRQTVKSVQSGQEFCKLPS